MPRSQYSPRYSSTMKRLSAEVGGLTHPPAKRRCYQSQEEVVDDRAATSTSRLELLPAELLLLILDFSLEPSLIHTSRRLYNSLPYFVPFSKILALRALSPQSPPAKVVEAIDHLRTIPSVFETRQDGVRRTVFSSSWFQEHHLRYVHRRLLHGTILDACSHSKDGPSRGQRKRIKSFVDKETEFSSVEQLNLR